MKLRIAILRITSSIPLCLLGFLPFMQDNFPWQYNLNGIPSRWGSRYELLFYIIIPMVIGWICYYWFMNNEKQMIQKNTKFIITFITIIVVGFEILLVWLIMNGLSMDTVVSIILCKRHSRI